jgi:Fe-S-cluster containining protein
VRLLKFEFPRMKVTTKKDNPFDHYTQLLAKADQMFDIAAARHPGQFQCGAGCYACCQPGLTVTHVEAARIREWLSDHAELSRVIRSGDGMLADQGYCGMLDADGRCSIYEVRPLICRSHGMPVSWKTDEAEARDCCPLNFKEIDLDSLDPGDVLSLDKLNMILSAVDHAYDSEKSGERVLITDLV